MCKASTIAISTVADSGFCVITYRIIEKKRTETGEHKHIYILATKTCLKENITFSTVVVSGGRFWAITRIKMSFELTKSQFKIKAPLEELET